MATATRKVDIERFNGALQMLKWGLLGLEADPRSSTFTEAVASIKWASDELEVLR